jgi:hypothetical protein
VTFSHEVNDLYAGAPRGVQLLGRRPKSLHYCGSATGGEIGGKNPGQGLTIVTPAAAGKTTAALRNLCPRRRLPQKDQILRLSRSWKYGSWRIKFKDFVDMEQVGGGCWDLVDNKNHDSSETARENWARPEVIFQENTT